MRRRDATTRHEVKRMIRPGASAVMLIGAAALSAGAQTPVTSVEPKVSCSSMRGFDPRIPDAPTQITEAREVVLEGATACVVKGYVSPQVRFEVRLPLHGWTQRYLQTGCGGLCGDLSVRAPQRASPMLQRGELATASTDMGHQGPGGTWAASDPQLRVDFAYRGVHVTALVAKALIAQFYGQPPRWSYFSGCSDGGREAMMEAQRYPSDFDGIAAGAPAFNFLVQNSFYHAWNARTVAPDPKSGAVLVAADLPILHRAAVGACDALDGVTDGLVADPTACRFDPATIACRSPGQTDCLTPEAVAAAKKLYAGARDADGRQLVIGGPQPGSELSWEGVFVPRTAQGAVFSGMIAGDMLRSLGYWRPLPPDWDLGQFRFTAETLEGLMPMHGLYDATDPDLSAFARRGGKLLVWHGWSDPHISPLNSIAYAQAVSDRMGAKAGRAVLRLFLIPGMYHCGDGDGMTSVDVLTPLMQWVEGGTAPDVLVASHDDADAAAGKGRAIFAWPATSALAAGEDAERPASWRDGPPIAAPPALYKTWAGARLFEPGYQQECRFDGSTFVCRPRR
jgi:feruloyl esterase